MYTIAITDFVRQDLESREMAACYDGEHNVFAVIQANPPAEGTGGGPRGSPASPRPELELALLAMFTSSPPHVGIGSIPPSALPSC